MAGAPEQKSRRFDRDKLWDKDLQEQYNNEIHNGFDSLEKEKGIAFETMDEACKIIMMMNILILLRRWLEQKQSNDKPWITHREKEELQKDNTRRNEEVKIAARRDKRKCIDDLAGEAETAAENGNMAIRLHDN